MKKSKTQKGITLIALIITIVVLLILAVVAISSIQNDGIISYANNAAIAYNQAQVNEQEILDGYLSHMPGNGGTVETITTETSYTGCYVNLDADPDPDGIIYIDLAQTASGSWTLDAGGDYAYTITNVTSGLKDYTVIGEHTTDEFGTAQVLEAVAGKTGTERFYVMALEDINPGTYYSWYEGAYNSGINDYSTVTSTRVGSGKTNTETMMTAWNAGTYGEKNNGSYADLWGVLEDGWYVPSYDEWVAFGSILGISSSNYSSKGLRDSYWSSSMDLENSANYVGFYCDYMLSGSFYEWHYVRLGTTF